MPEEEDEDEVSPKDRAIEEEEERGKKESSRLGEGKLFFLVWNIAHTCRNQVKRCRPRQVQIFYMTRIIDALASIGSCFQLKSSQRFQRSCFLKHSDKSVKKNKQ